MCFSEPIYMPIYCNGILLTCDNSNTIELRWIASISLLRCEHDKVVPSIYSSMMTDRSYIISHLPVQSWCTQITIPIGERHTASSIQKSMKSSIGLTMCPWPHFLFKGDDIFL